MKKIALLLLIISINLLIFSPLKAAPVNLVGKWDLVRVETADGKSKPHPSKPKMGGAEFFKDKTVVFSDGLKGVWTVSTDGSLKIVLMEFLEMSGVVQGDLLKLSTMVDPDEVLVLKRQK
jgi:hypothetical protein